MLSKIASIRFAKFDTVFDLRAVRDFKKRCYFRNLTLLAFFFKTHTYDPRA